MKEKEICRNERKGNSKKEKGSIYRQHGEQFGPQDSDLTVMRLIPRRHVDRENFCGYPSTPPTTREV